MTQETAERIAVAIEKMAEYERAVRDSNAKMTEDHYQFCLAKQKIEEERLAMDRVRAAEDTERHESFMSTTRTHTG